MTNVIKPNSAHALAIVLATSLVAMYGIVPAQPELFGIGPRSATMITENIVGATVLALIVGLAGRATLALKTEREPVPIHPLLCMLIFAGGCYWLSGNSWILVREGFEGSISAVFRILWFVVVVNVRQTKLNLVTRLLYTSATIILMLLDQSRTYFLIALLILLTDLGWIAVIPGIIAALLVAAIRSSENYGFVHSIMFAIGGEGYLGSQGVFQVLSIGDSGIDFSVPATQALFSPVTASLTIVLKRLGYSADLLDSSTYLGNYIRATTGDTYPPMGGFFILSEFVRAGWFGIACMAAYIVTALAVTKRLFDTAEFPVGSFIFILAIKNSPLTYWNLVISVFLVSYLLRKLGSVLWSPQVGSADRARQGVRSTRA